MNAPLTVTELTFQIKKQLESKFVSVSVRGEISNLKEQSSGHLYFTLKDETCQISAVLFKGNARTLSRLPKGGDQVIVKGELTVYPPRGTYQILVRELEYAGVGELLLKLHELKLKLTQKGWFDAQHKKALPKLPQTIGVVTSPTGSVIQDIINVLSRRFQNFHLVLNPVKVQGEGAAQEIARAIEEFNKYNLADVLIVGRGGGSLEDLWAFNEEIVAAAIFASKIPVISAVGHETDFCIADYVADIRAPTPSAAAEIAIAEKSGYLQFLAQAKRGIKQKTFSLIKEERLRLNGFLRQPFFHSPLTLLGKYYQLLDDMQTRLDLAFSQILKQKRLHLIGVQKQVKSLKPSTQIAQHRQKIFPFHSQIARVTKELVAKKKKELERLSAHLKSIDPRNLLTKGYCILFPEKKSSAILGACQLKVDEKVKILLHDGEAIAHVNEIKLL